MVAPHQPEALHLLPGGLCVTEVKQKLASCDEVIRLSLDVYHISSFPLQFS